MVFHENRLLADNSHDKSYLNFFQKLGKTSQNLSSAAVVIGALSVNCVPTSTKIQDSSYNSINNCKGWCLVLDCIDF